jgi:hypothetical protein
VAALADRFTDQVKALLAFAGLSALTEGYVFTHEPYIGSIRHGNTDSLTLTLQSRTSYILLGVCDEDCKDVDLRLYDERDNLIDSDIRSDTVPVVSVIPRWTARFRVEVIMNQCRSSPCKYGVGVLSKLSISGQEPSTSVKSPEIKQAPSASVESPEIKTGDTYIIEYLHPDKPESNYILERKVVSVGEGKITVTSRNIKSKTGKARILQFTSEWNLISSRNIDEGGFDYSPPLKYFAFPLYPGKTWQQKSQETNIKTGTVREHTLSATVGEWEDVSVPAGTFRTIKISIQTELLDRATEQKSTGIDISWYAPTIRRSVKSVITSQNFQGQQERQLIQMIQYDVK